MTLPTSRNTDYAPESPVRSADLNDIQDCIVEGKFASREFILGPAAFHLRYSSQGGNGNSLYWPVATSDSYIIMCDLAGVIPVGSRITSIKWSYNRSGGSFARAMRTRNLATGAAETIVVGVTTDITSSGFVVVTDTVTHTLVADETAFLDLACVGVGTTNSTFYGAIVTADKL